MAKSINEVTLFGYVGKDPEIKTLQDGSNVASFSLATSTGGFKKADGREVPEVTQWHNIVAWRSLANLAKFIHKGDKVIVKGSISYHSYDNKDGQKVNVTDIIANDISLTAKPVQAQVQQPQQGFQNYQQPSAIQPQQGYQQSFPTDDPPF